MQVQNEVKQDGFRVGDVVWDVVFGKGSVYKISEMVYYSIKVEFENGFEESFTPDGKIHEESNRTLFFSEPKIEASVTRPFVPTLVGKRVVVKLFSHLTEGTVCSETSCSFLLESGTSFSKQDIQAIYEISSENLLTSKK